ncbi:MAG: NUDIX hydrolase [Burkholderiaceae bacterium]
MPDRWKPNVTVAAVIERDKRFLLVEEHTGSGLRLNNPAGHLDPGESLVQACSRETLEETAFDFRPTGLIGIYLSPPAARAPAPAIALLPVDVATAGIAGTGTTYLRFAFCGELGQWHEKRALDQGIVRTLWLGIDEIRASWQRHRSALLLQCVEDYLAGARYPLALLATEGVAGIARG